MIKVNLNRTQLNRQRKQGLLFAIFVFTVVGLVSLLIPVYSSAQTRGEVYKADASQYISVAGSVAFTTTAGKKSTNKKSNAYASYNPQQSSISALNTTNATHSQAKKEEKSDYTFSLAAQVSRGTSLVDHQDGTRSDSSEVLVAPSLSTPIGRFSAKLTYSQNLNDADDVQAGISDASITYATKSIDWALSTPHKLMLTPSLTTIVPLSKISVKKNQMQTALIAGISLGVAPDSSAAGQVLQKEGAWMAGVSLTAGRNFYPYEEDINGQPLNAYTSNQSLSAGYIISKWSFSVELVHRSRWTFQGNTKASFAASEEIGYSITDHFSVAIGHTNDAAAMKANGVETNYNLVDDNTSSVYISAGASF